jgi:hypothetical protein
MRLRTKALTLIVLGSIFLIACGSFFPFGRSPHGMNPGYGYRWSRFDSNGEQIYFTATNDRGEYIRYTGGLPFGGMMEGTLACASCHGEDGRGGQHVMHMDVMDAPDIRIAVLSAESDEHQEGEHEDEHGEEYDLEAFRQAVVLGQHPDGDSLSRDMPRWQIDGEDLNDLFKFLNTLP